VNVAAFPLAFAMLGYLGYGLDWLLARRARKRG